MAAKTEEQLYRIVDLSDIVKTGESSEPVTYVGVYVLRWGKEDHPSVGFIPVESTHEPDDTTLANALQEILDLAQTELPVTGFERGMLGGDLLDQIAGIAAKILGPEKEPSDKALWADMVKNAAKMQDLHGDDALEKLINQKHGKNPHKIDPELGW